ncbi:MAG: DNA-processing protein DprA [Actinomycetes bacterium]
MSTAREVAIAALIALPHMTPARLHRVLDRWGDPEIAVEAIARGRGSGVLSSEPRLDATERSALAAAWRAIDPGASGRLLAARGTRATCVLDPDWPLDDGVDLPAALLLEGDRPDCLAQPRIAVVGTRAATPHGLADAHDLAAALAEAGVCVVSGLALGIDGAAHRGAVEVGGTTIGVLATGLDVIYPRRHATLHAEVRAHGLTVTEHPHGTGPRPERFPVRNRIIAALGDVVVVVEAAARGGALSTAAHATRLGRPVLAQPGSRRNPAAAGTNSLIADGATPLLDPADALLALTMTPGARRGPLRVPSRPTPRRPPRDPAARAVLRALSGDAATPDELAARTGCAPAAIARTVAALEAEGRVQRSRGLIWPR